MRVGGVHEFVFVPWDSTLASLQALYCCGQDLKGDREIVMAAVRQNGLALRFATEETLGRTPKEACSTRGRSRHLLETAFSEPLLRTLLRTLFYCKMHSRTPFSEPFPRTLPRTCSEPFLERCVAVRPLRRAPKFSQSPGSGQKKI